MRAVRRPLLQATARGTAWIGAVIMLDAAYFSVLTPLLPALGTQLGIGSAKLGQVSGAYMLGILVGIVPAGAVAMVMGARNAAILGVCVLGGGGLAVGFGGSFVEIVAARGVQGFGSAVAWAGAMAWVISTVPLERRGRAVGNMLAAAFLGSFLGPLAAGLGILFGWGRPTVFAGLGGLCAICAAGVWTRASPVPPIPSARLRASPKPRWVKFTTLGVAAALTVLAVSIAGGARLVLPALFLAENGVASSMIAMLYSGAGLGMTLVALVAGRLADRRGPDGMVPAGAAAAALCALLYALMADRNTAMILILALGCSVQVVMTAGFAVIARENERVGLDPAISWTWVNSVWTGGFFVGSILPTWLASTWSLAGAWSMVAFLVVLTGVTSMGVSARTRR